MESKSTPTFDEVDLNYVSAALQLYVENIMGSTEWEPALKRDMLRSIFDLQEKVERLIDGEG